MGKYLHFGMVFVDNFEATGGKRLKKVVEIVDILAGFDHRCQYLILIINCELRYN